MDPLVAFFDDAGSPDPDKREFYVLGVVVMPLRLVKTIGDQWWDIVKTSLRLRGQPPDLGVEIKWTDLNEYVRRIKAGAKQDRKFDALYASRLDLDGVKSLYLRLVSFIANAPDITCIAACVHKKAFWEQFHGVDYAAYCGGMQSKSIMSMLRARLRHSACKRAFEYGVLQRVQYLTQEKGDASCLLIGDQGSVQDTMHSHQYKVQGGRSSYHTSATNIVNNVVFGSSMYSPGLQMADWVASAVNQWARNGTAHMLSLLRVRFRNAPSIQGRGLVLMPDARWFPPIPSAPEAGQNK